MISVERLAKGLLNHGIIMLAGKRGDTREIKYITTIELQEKTTRIREKGSYCQHSMLLKMHPK